MSKLARALMVVGMLAAMNLAAMTAVAQAQPSNDPPSGQADATVQRLLARERSSIPGAAHPRLLLDEERSTLLNLPSAGPAPASSPVRAAEHSSRPSWPALAVLAVALALSTAVAVLAARRTNARHRAGQTA